MLYIKYRRSQYQFIKKNECSLSYNTKYILASITMSSNRLQYFIRNILQNSKLNRLKFVKNKKKYNDLSVNNKTNNNLILKRKFNTSTEFQ